MTLVIARQYGDEIFIISDTRISTRGGPKPLYEGVIKCCIASSNIVVAFANSPDFANRDISDFAVEFGAGANFIKTKRFFEKSSRETANDYIVAFARPAKLLKISEGKATQMVAAWIGDQDAFDRFREYEARARVSLHGNVWHASLFDGTIREKNRFGSLLQHFESVAMDREVASVGGFFTVVTNSNGEFSFRLVASLFFDGPSDPLIPDGSHPLAASGENRLYAMSICAPVEPGTTACAFYFPLARLAYAFSPGKGAMADRCTVFRDVSEDELRARSKEELGIDFNYLLASHLGPP